MQWETSHFLNRRIVVVEKMLVFFKMGQIIGMESRENV